MSNTNTEGRRGVEIVISTVFLTFFVFVLINPTSLVAGNWFLKTLYFALAIVAAGFVVDGAVGYYKANEETTTSET